VQPYNIGGSTLLSQNSPTGLISDKQGTFTSKMEMNIIQNFEASGGPPNIKKITIVSPQT